MERVIANLGAARKETMGGRNYLVAPATLIVSGVLNGSRGRLFYPQDEVEREPGAWNHIPLVVYHPTDKDGNHISARRQDVLDKSAIGILLNDESKEGKRQAEAWFEVDAVRRVDAQMKPEARIMPRLEAGKPIELSTGLFVDTEPVGPGAAFNGEFYDYVARNYRPDHLAILPDEVGACSNSDGCGINVNKTGWVSKTLESIARILGINQQTGSDDMNRNQMIDFLATNCDCWKGDKATLNKFADDKLKKLVTNARTVIIVNKVKGKPIVNAEGEGEAVAGVPWMELAALLGVELNPTDDPIEFAAALKAKIDEISSKLSASAPAEPVAPEEEVVAMGEDEDASKPVEEPATNRKKGKQQTEAQWLRNAPPGIQSAVRNAMEVERRERIALVHRLVANVEDDARRQIIGKKYMAKTLEELRDMAELIPTANIERDEPQVYFGAGGFASNAGGEEIEVLDLDEARKAYDPIYNRRQAAV